MEKKINNILLVTAKDGSQLTFKVLFTYHSENFNKDYVAFYNENDENDLIVFSYDENSTLYELESQEEYKELDEVLHKFDEEQASRKNQQLDDESKKTDIEKFEIFNNYALTEYNGNDSRVVIPEGIKEIEGYVFHNCDFLLEVSIPDSIENIDGSNFSECKNLKFNEIDGVKYLGNENNPYLVLVSADLNIKECNIKEGCKLIMEKAFQGHSELVRVFIPSSVKYIGFMAFYDCNLLSELSISEGVEKIHSNAFENCSIKKLKLPNSIKYIDRDAFSIVSLEEVTIPEEIIFIGSGAFAYNNIKFNEYEEAYYFGSDKNPYLCFVKPKDANITNINIHKNCRIIYSDAFMRCKNLKNIEMPKGLLQIGENAFRECFELENITIPEGLMLIGECAFASCEKLNGLKFPNNEITIESGAFMGCCSIESLELINAIVSDNAFYGCEKLEKLIVGPNSNLYGDYIFAGCVSLREVILPEVLRNRFTIDEFEDSENVKIKYV